MDDLTRTASEIIGYQWHAPESGFYLSSSDAAQDRRTLQENQKRFCDSVPPLEEAMSKYLNFHAL